MDDQAIRTAALAAAATALSGTSPQPGDLTAYAGELVPWITGSTTTRLEATLTIPGTPIRIHSSNGGSVATTATIDNNAVVIQVVTRDAAGNITQDPVSWLSTDTAGDILDATVSADGRTWTGVITKQTGSVTVTASVPSAPAATPFTADITVTSGGTASVSGTVTVT